MSAEASQSQKTLNRRSALQTLGGAVAVTATVLREATPALAQPRAPRQVTIATVSANYREGLERIANEYSKQRPDIAVKVQILPVNGYETWLRTQIPGGGSNAPDIFNANYAWGLFEKGLMVNLSPYIASKNPYTGKIWIETLNKQFIEKFKIGGDVSNIPMDSIEIGFYYNIDIFRRLNLQPPATWEAMLALSDRIRAAGILPFAVPGNADSYWSGTVGWIARFFSDAYSRHLVPQILSQPGDWDYDAKKNRAFRLDLRDPYNDAYVVTNSERMLNLIRQGVIRFDGERFREAYANIKTFSRHWQRGFHGASAQTAYHLFLTGRAAIALDTSQQIGQLLKDVAELPTRSRFQWGVFPVPPITQSRFSVPPFRGVGGPGSVWGVVKKDPAQEKAALDFLMYMTTPRSAKILIEEALRNKKPLVGPMLIPGAELPPEIKPYFRAFEGRGFERLSFRGLMDEQQSSWEWTVWAQRYMDGRIDLDTFLQRYQRLMTEAIPRVIAAQKLDLNPATKDRK